MSQWSEWRPFPDPEELGYIQAPLGIGLYELRNVSTGELVLFGVSAHCAYRMSSLHPEGAGTRRNIEKRAYVGRHLKMIEYRTRPFHTIQEARRFERALRSRGTYLFGM